MGGRGFGGGSGGGRFGHSWASGLDDGVGRVNPKQTQTGLVSSHFGRQGTPGLEVWIQNLEMNKNDKPRRGAVTGSTLGFHTYGQESSIF